MVDFSGMTLKIERADQLLAQLNTEIATAFDPSRYEVERKVEGAKVVYYAHNVPQIHPMWPVKIGETLQHLRSALDHFAYQLVLHDGGAPTVGPGGTQFPIMAAPPKNGVFDLRPSVSQPIRNAVEEHQPYQQGPHAAYLQYLADLNNADKHRLLLVLIAGYRFTSTTWTSVPGDPEPKTYLNLTGIGEGDHLITFDFENNEPPANFDPGPFKLDVQFGEGDPGSVLRTHSLMNVLPVIRHKVVNRVIRGIAQGLGL